MPADERHRRRSPSRCTLRATWACFASSSVRDRPADLPPGTPPTTATETRVDDEHGRGGSSTPEPRHARQADAARRAAVSGRRASAKDSGHAGSRAAGGRPPPRSRSRWRDDHRRNADREARPVRARTTPAGCGRRRARSVATRRQRRLGRAHRLGREPGVEDPCRPPAARMSHSTGADARRPGRRGHTRAARTSRRPPSVERHASASRPPWMRSGAGEWNAGERASRANAARRIQRSGELRDRGDPSRPPAPARSANPSGSRRGTGRRDGVRAHQAAPSEPGRRRSAATSRVRRRATESVTEQHATSPGPAASNRTGVGDAAGRPSRPAATGTERTGTRTAASASARSMPPSDDQRRRHSGRVANGGARRYAEEDLRAGTRRPRGGRSPGPRARPRRARDRRLVGAGRRARSSATASAAHATGTTDASELHERGDGQQRHARRRRTRLPNRCSQPVAGEEPRPDGEVRGRRDGDAMATPRTARGRLVEHEQRAPPAGTLHWRRRGRRRTTAGGRPAGGGPPRRRRR